jgi:hypothetical protein
MNGKIEVTPLQAVLSLVAVAIFARWPKQSLSALQAFGVATVRLQEERRKAVEAAQGQEGRGEDDQSS